MRETRNLRDEADGKLGIRLDLVLRCRVRSWIGEERPAWPVLPRSVKPVMGWPGNQGGNTAPQNTSAAITLAYAHACAGKMICISAQAAPPAHLMRSSGC